MAPSAKSNKSSMPDTSMDPEVERALAVALAEDVLLGPEAWACVGLTSIQSKLLRRLNIGKADAKFFKFMREKHPNFDKVVIPIMFKRGLIYYRKGDQWNNEIFRIMPRGIVVLKRRDEQERVWKARRRW